MYGEHLIYVAISIEIAALTAVLFFLAKEGLSGLLKWLGYILLLVGFLILACTVTRGLTQMMHHNSEMEHHEGMMHGGCPMMGHGQGGMHCCDMDDNDKECCKKDSADAKDHKAAEPAKKDSTAKAGK